MTDGRCCLKIQTRRSTNSTTHCSATSKRKAHQSNWSDWHRGRQIGLQQQGFLRNAQTPWKEEQARRRGRLPQRYTRIPQRYSIVGQQNPKFPQRFPRWDNWFTQYLRCYTDPIHIVKLIKRWLIRWIRSKRITFHSWKHSAKILRDATRTFSTHMLSRSTLLHWR